MWANVGFFNPIKPVSQRVELQAGRPAERQGLRGGKERPRRPDPESDAIAGKSYLVDDKFSLADLAVSSYFGRLGFMGYDYSPFKNVARAGRCLGRPPATSRRTAPDRGARAPPN